MFALEFPPLGHIVNWPNFIGPQDAWWGINKVVLIYFMSAILTIGIFVLGTRKKALVPTGTQNFVETAVEFVEDQIVMETMGKEGLKYTPYLVSLMFFIFFCNIFEVIREGDLLVVEGHEKPEEITHGRWVLIRDPGSLA